MTKPLLETLSEILPKEKNVNSGEGLPFENSPEIYGNRRIVAYANGANAMLSEVKLLLPQIIEAVRGDTVKELLDPFYTLSDTITLNPETVVKLKKFLTNKE
jgi:hypothetical protein